MSDASVTADEVLRWVQNCRRLPLVGDVLERREHAATVDLIAAALVFSAHDIPDPRRIKTLFRKDDATT